MAQYFVRKTGSDANSGLSAALAKLTIQAAVNLATSAGDIVYVGAGAYHETVTPAANGTAGNTISFIGDFGGTQTGDAGVVRVTGYATDFKSRSRTTAFECGGRSYLTMRGFTVDGTTGYGGAIGLDSSAHHVTIDRCVVWGSKDGYGIYNGGASQSDITISNCVFFCPEGWVWYLSTP